MRHFVKNLENIPLSFEYAMMKYLLHVREMLKYEFGFIGNAALHANRSCTETNMRLFSLACLRGQFATGNL